MTESLDINKLKEDLRDFAEARDWNHYHNPKNLSMALSVEASELLEIFQWLKPEEAVKIKQNSLKKQAVSEEVADILLYLVRLADILEIDIPKAVQDKLEKNTQKYPVGKTYSF